MSQSKGLTAILVAGYLCNDLGGNITCCEKTVWLLDHGLADHSTVLKHILKVDQIAVVFPLGIII